MGSPPNCRPECTINADCLSNLACIREKCTDPCPGSCGILAICSVINHIPICKCPEGYSGDPFRYCEIKPVQPVIDTKDPCNPPPCGANAHCDNGICSCVPEYLGDPYSGCRPECVLSTDCSKEKACIGNKCIDPCPGTCGDKAECIVVNHIPMCSCLEGYTGNAFFTCTLLPVKEKRNPCYPSPCGPNSQCREMNDQAVCSCVPGYIGSPPTCRPECIISQECFLNQACVNQKCIDPCPGTCGLNAKCQVVNHNPFCSCLPNFVGDPFVRCLPKRKLANEVLYNDISMIMYILEKEPLLVPAHLCQPSPCGPYSQCKVIGDSPSCSCLPDYSGTPPNCRPECISNSECLNQLACINQKCKDPCPGVCGPNAECRVISHTPNCLCQVGYIGDPFNKCVPKPGTLFFFFFAIKY